MKNKYFILFICLIIFIIVISVSVSIFSNSKGDNSKEKIEQELSYLETKIIGMLNSLNYISFSNGVILEQNTVKDKSEESNESKENNSSQSGGSTQNQSSNDSSGSSSNSNTENKSSSDYTKYNIESNNILMQNNEKIDWDFLKDSAQIIESSWPTIMIDLNSIGVNNDDILRFSNELDSLIINIQKEDKNETLKNLVNLYLQVPIYLQQVLKSDYLINISNTKASIIESYALINEEKWNEAKQKIESANNYFMPALNNTNEEKEESTVAQSYICINELNNSIKYQDKKLFYLKYINLMENLLKL